MGDDGAASPTEEVPGSKPMMYQVRGIKPTVTRNVAQDDMSADGIPTTGSVSRRRSRKVHIDVMVTADGDQSLVTDQLNGESLSAPMSRASVLSTPAQTPILPISVAAGRVAVEAQKTEEAEEE